MVADNTVVDALHIARAHFIGISTGGWKVMRLTINNPYKVAERAKQLLPHVEVHVLPESGHGCIYDQPEKANAKIIDFLLNKGSHLVNT